MPANYSESDLASLKEIIDDDTDNILGTKGRKHSESSTPLINSFEEIIDFYETYDRTPSIESNSIYEKKLAFRLIELSSNPEYRQKLELFDFYNLLNTTQSDNFESIEDIIQSDDDNILNDDNDVEDIAKLKFIKKSERQSPDQIMRREVCPNFDQYEADILKVRKELSTGIRKLAVFNENDLKSGHYYVLKGILFYLASMDLSENQYSYESGVRTRIDGRTLCIFDNGTQSRMNMRSLVKAMNIDGKSITEPLSPISFNDSIDSKDVMTGYIYVLKSKSTSPVVTKFTNLYKIGYTTDSVEERIKNAEHESTYLNAPVTIISTYAIHNVDASIIEDAIHTFFAEANIRFDVTGKDLQYHQATEWYDVPLPSIREAMSYISKGTATEYHYDATMKMIVRNRL